MPPSSGGYGTTTVTSFVVPLNPKALAARTRTKYLPTGAGTDTDHVVWRLPVGWNEQEGEAAQRSRNGDRPAEATVRGTPPQAQGGE